MIELAPILCYSFVALARLPVTFAFQPLGHHSLSHKYWPCRKSLLLRTKPSGDGADDDEGERLFFDDFGGGFVGSAGASSSSSSFTSSLSERITSAKKDEEVTSAKLAKNWKTGNWGVRGFILDSSDPIRESVADVTASSTEGAGPRLGGNDMRSSSALEVPPIHVSTIVADQSHMHDEGGDVIFFGLGSYVNGYYVNDVIGSASVGGICPIPSSRFQANDGGVTAILAAGQGTSMSSSLQQARPTTILLTGGADGMVKQW